LYQKKHKNETEEEVDVSLIEISNVKKVVQTIKHSNVLAKMLNDAQVKFLQKKKTQFQLADEEEIRSQYKDFTEEELEMLDYDSFEG
jgi:hypothetical protein